MRASLYLLAGLVAASAVAGAGERAPGALRVSVAAGGGAINSLLSDWARPVTVEVRDGNGSPVSGALVTMILPSDGPGAAFSWGSDVDTRQTSPDGRVVFNGMRLRHVPGEFPIRITASANGVRSTAETTQAVAGSDTGAGGRSWRSKRTLLMLGIGGAGAALGAWGALRSGDDADPPAPTITPGIPVITGPRP